VSRASSRWRRLHPGTIALRFVKEAPSTVLALPAGAAFISDAGVARALWWAALLGIVLLFFSWLGWSRFRYAVGQNEIRIESGVLARNRRSIPFDRIQDIDLERSLLARLFGLAKVRIETGAGGKDEGLLDSVSVHEAHRLRETVRAWRGTAALSAENPAETERPTSRPLFEMTVGRVLLHGLFNFSLVYLAGLFALLQSVDQFLPFDIYDPARWVGLVGDYLPTRFSFQAIAAVAILAGLLGVVAGVLRTLARNYGYRLGLEGDRFRRERGLLTRSEVVIARRRVQLAQVETGPVRRALGWFALDFQTLGAGSDAGGRQSAAPFASRDEIETILREGTNLRLPPPPELTRVSQRHVVRTLLGSVLPVLAAILALSFWLKPALLLLFLLPALAVLAVLERRFHRYGLAGDLLFVERGVWRQRLWVVPLAKVQSLSLSRGPLQRRLGLATLAFDTAGAPLLNIPRIIDLRADFAEALAAEVSRRRRGAVQASGRKSGTERYRSPVS
jgi:putative membrane protein